MDYSLDYNKDFIKDDKAIAKKCYIPLLRGRCISDRKDLIHLKGLRWNIRDNRCLKVIVRILDIKTVQLQKGIFESSSKDFDDIGVGVSKKKSKVDLVLKIAMGINN